MRATYYVTTWDGTREEFTPQAGVRTGPYRLMGLRRPLRALRDMGYEVNRSGGFSVLVEKKVDGQWQN